MRAEPQKSTTPSANDWTDTKARRRRAQSAAATLLCGFILLACAGAGTTRTERAGATTPVAGDTARPAPADPFLSDPSPAFDSKNTHDTKLPEQPANDERHTEDLSVPGHRAAVLSVPPGAARAPVLIALHGAGDRAEEHCAHFAAIAGQHAFILCPRGVPMTRHPQTGYFFRDHLVLGKEIQAALEVLRASYPRADTEGMVLAGYSQGSTMGSLHAHTVPAQISRLLLVEGGFDEWDVGTSKRFLAAGGKRVALVCGIAHCAERSKHAKSALSRAGVPVQIAHVPGGGHTYAGRVGQRAAALLPWLVEDDNRWNSWRNATRSDTR